jgi:hypothetical protein
LQNSPFHGGNTGSIPVGRASKIKYLARYGDTASTGVPEVSRRGMSEGSDTSGPFEPK